MDLGTVEDHVAMLTSDLVGYQDERYARSFLHHVGNVAAMDPADRDHLLTRTAASSLHKLMAYKDEYEVARLMLLPEAKAAVESVGGRGATFRWLLHPPTLAAMGRSRKLRFGGRTGWIFAGLRAARRLRGTTFDPFGRTEIRRVERALVPEFEEALTVLARAIDDIGYDEAVRIAALPDRVRGFEDLKLRRASDYREELQRSLPTGG